MEAITGEKTLLESDTKELTLTTHRVRFDSGKIGSAHVISIMLEALSSCEIRYTSNPALLVVAAVAIIIGIVLEDSTVLTIGFVTALVLGLIYLATRKQLIWLASAGSSIRVATSGMGLESARRFIDEVERAKDHRYMMLKQR